jgi:Predicted membrane protein
MEEQDLDVQNTAIKGEGDNIKSDLQIGKKAFILAFVILSLLMILAYILTLVVPQGEYLVAESDSDSREIEYVKDADGNPVFNYIDGEKLPFWKFILAPFLVLAPSGGDAFTLYGLMALLLCIGGVFNVLDKSGALKYMISKVINKFKDKKLTLLAVVSLMFMALGSTVGMLEETVPFIPIMIMLCYFLGLDSICALAMTIMAAGLGFSAGVLNPFTAMIALKLGGMDIGDGIIIRIIVFILTYGILMAFMLPYAKKILLRPDRSLVFSEDEKARAEIQAEMQVNFIQNEQMDKAVKWFIYNFGFLGLFVVVSLFVNALASYTMYVIIVVYISCGIGAGLLTKTGIKLAGKQFLSGALTVAPAIIMILMAVSVKFILAEGNVLDTVLYSTVNLMNKTPKTVRPLILYLVVFLLNFFISSGSSKAYLLMPILYPISDFTGVARLVTVTAFLFGDGFSNMIFPTNGALLIALSLSPVSYGKWFKWSIKVQGALLAMSVAVLLILNAVL